jgi:protein involved in polysaccharide export with SLBB domain
VSKDISLEQGDIIFIPIIRKTARAYGSFRRPQLFEIKDKETVKDLIFLAGGVKSQAQLGGKFELTSFKPDSVEVNEFSALDNSWLDKSLNDGDTLSARTDSVYFNGVVQLTGEFKFPGFFRIKKNEKLSSVIRRAGGYTSAAYPLGAIFKRKSVAIQQKLSFERSADDLEQNIADALTSGATKDLTGDAFIPLTNIITRLRELTPSGRQVIEADILKIKSDPRLDFVLQEGDTLEIPSRPTQVTVVGEVLNPSSFIFSSGEGLHYYINHAGGFKDTAETSSVFMIMPNGEAQSYSLSKFRRRDESYAIPGTIIVVRREARPAWLGIAATMTPLITSSAVSIASIIALLDN